MSNGPYAGLRMAARAAQPDPETNPNEPEPDEDEDDTSASSEQQKDKKPMDTNCNADAVAQAVNAERQRTSAVLASEHYAGREKLAASLLETELSADQIVTALAASNAAPAKAEADPESAARDEVRTVLGANANSGIEPGAGTSPQDDAKASDASWDRAYDRMCGSKN